MDYTEFHFLSEEKAMEAAGFSGLEEHRREHEELKKAALEFHERLKQEGESLRAEFYHFLRDWLIHHIVESDMKYSTCLQEYVKKAA